MCLIASLIVGIGLFLCAVYFRHGFQQGLQQLQQMHQVPCSRCAYFTGDLNLKCTVHPCNAFTDRAIDCRDFEQVSIHDRPFKPSHSWKY